MIPLKALKAPALPRLDYSLPRNTKLLNIDPKILFSALLVTKVKHL